MNERIQPMERRHARAIATLHRQGIHTGFLSSLGLAFLRQLYAAIPSCPCGFGLVWEESDGEILGFIACAESTGRLYKQALWRRGIRMALPLLRFMLRPSVIRRMFQTLRYPSRMGEDLPTAEVLSIVAAERARGKGVAKALMDRALAELARRELQSVKVAVWAGNEVANKFYRKCGFSLAVTREHHGLPMNIYVRPTA